MKEPMTLHFGIGSSYFFLSSQKFTFSRKEIEVHVRVYKENYTFKTDVILWGKCDFQKNFRIPSYHSIKAVLETYSCTA